MHSKKYFEEEQKKIGEGDTQGRRKSAFHSDANYRLQNI